MRDTKSLLLLILSMLLIIVSLALLWIWGYNYGTQKTLSKKQNKDTVSIAVPVNDSMKLLYQEAKNNFSAIDSVLFIADSLKIDIGDRMLELNNLRDEIKDLLKKPGDLKEIQNAQEKIGKLQDKVDELLDQNKDIIKENHRLTRLIRQMSKMPASNNEAASAKVVTNPSVSGKSNKESAAAIAEMIVKGWMDNNGTSVETLHADELNGLNGSFLFTNQSGKSIGDLYVVISRPDGKTLRSSGWESGSFETAEGRRVYTCKISYAVSSGDTKKLSFSFPAENCPKGNYQVSIYQSGNSIGNSGFQFN